MDGNGAGTLHNRDVDWHRWPVQDYLSENYRELHPADAAVIDHHSAFYRRLAPGSVDRSLELGAGPNLYPLMLAAAASRHIDAVEPGRPNVAYLRRQLRHGADPSWQPFYHRCRQRNPDLPATLAEALSRVRITVGTAATVRPDSYGLASMNFVAESITEARAEFVAVCHAFLRTVRPGGHLVASFMENMGRYRIGAGPAWPGCRVDADTVREAFAPGTEQLTLARIDADPSLPDWGYTGMIMLTARRTGSAPPTPRSAGDGDG